MNNEKLRHIISLIGEDKIKKVYDYSKGEKISFAALHRIVLFDKIKERIGKGQSICQIAKEYCISRMTVYRIFHRLRRKNP